MSVTFDDTEAPRLTRVACAAFSPAASLDLWAPRAGFGSLRPPPLHLSGSAYGRPRSGLLDALSGEPLRISSRSEEAIGYDGAGYAQAALRRHGSKSRTDLLERLRALGPMGRLARVAELRDAAIDVATMRLRRAHPDWSEHQLEREARRSLLYAGT